MCDANFEVWKSHSGYNFTLSELFSQQVSDHAYRKSRYIISYVCCLLAHDSDGLVTTSTLSFIDIFQ